MSFKMKYFEKCGPSTEKDVEGFERLIGKTLPEEYKHFLLEDGGGVHAAPCLFNIPGRGESIVKTLYGNSGNDYLSLRYYIEMTHTYPKGYLPIGDDPFGNRIVLGLSWPRKGKVYWCDHEITDEGYEKKPIKINDSFCGFIKTLKPDEIRT